jgi:bacteriocin-like protein
MNQAITTQELSDAELEQVVGGLHIVETKTHIKGHTKQSHSFKLSIVDTSSSNYSIDSVTQTLDIQP